MKLATLIFLLTGSLFACRGNAQMLVWIAPTNGTPQGYVIFHGTCSGAYSDCWSAGNGTNALLNVSLPAGPNYFVVTDFQMDTNGVLRMSSWSNEIVITNTPQLVLETILLTSTNWVGGTWRPWTTNRLVFGPGGDSQFFRAGELRLTRTNVITLPTTP